MKEEKKKVKRSKCLLVSWILGVMYGLYIISYFAGINTGNGETAEALGAGIATILVMPHMVVACLAAIFNIFGWIMNSRGFALTGAILYAIAIFFFPVYFMFVIVQMILSFVGFAKLKTIIQQNKAQAQPDVAANT